MFDVDLYCVYSSFLKYMPHANCIPFRLVALFELRHKTACLIVCINIFKTKCETRTMADGIPSLGPPSVPLFSPLPLPLLPFSPPTHISRRPRHGRRCRQSEELVDIGSDIGTRARRRSPPSFRYRKRSSSFCSCSIPCFNPAPSPAACHNLVDISVVEGFVNSRESVAVPLHTFTFVLKLLFVCALSCQSSL